MPSQNNPLLNPIMANQDFEEGRQQVDFSDIFQLIENTPGLASQNPEFIQLIRSITESMQTLSTLNRFSIENTHNAKEELALLLTSIAPYIAEYTGKGISRDKFNNLAQPFLTSLSTSPQNPNYARYWFNFCCILMPLFIGATLLYSGDTNLQRAERGYDDDHQGGGRRMRRLDRNEHSDARDSRFKKSGIGLEIAGGVFAFLGIISLIISIAKKCRENAHHAHTLEIETASRHIRTAIDKLYIDYCQPRKNLDFFESNKQRPPLYFSELAAKIFAAQLIISKRGDNRDAATINIFKAFYRGETHDSQKFNRLLREATSEELTKCLRRIVTVPVSETLTLQADHIFGSNAADYLLDLITQLREELHLLPWKNASSIDSASPEQLATAIQIYTGGSSSSTLYSYAEYAEIVESKEDAAYNSTNETIVDVTYAAPSAAKK